jgi:hypothetical protein
VDAFGRLGVVSFVVNHSLHWFVSVGLGIDEKTIHMKRYEHRPVGRMTANPSASAPTGQRFDPFPAVGFDQQKQPALRRLKERFDAGQLRARV